MPRLTSDVSLRLRLAVTYAVVVALVVGVLGTVLYVTMRETLGAEMDQRLQVRVEEIRYALWPPQVASPSFEMTGRQLDLSPIAQLEAPGRYVQVLDPSGSVIGLTTNMQGTPLPIDQANLQAARRGQSVFSDVTRGARTLRVLTAPVAFGNNVVAVIQVTQSREPLNETMAGLKQTLTTLGLAALGLAASVGWLVAYRGLQPLSEITSRAADIASKRNFGERLRLRRRRDEIGVLAETIDGLLAQVEHTLRTHREFVADTSHELRNPLLAIRTNLELVTRVADQEARDECIREAREQTERLSRLVSDLLLLAQIDRGLTIEHHRVALSAVCERAVQTARQHAAGHEISLQVRNAVQIIGDEGRLEQIVSNLLDNAIKHTPKGTDVGVTVDEHDGQARILVSDTGEGIAAEHLEHIFEREYRVKRGRRGSYSSYGLGLAIVHYLTQAHGGQVEVRSVVGEGSCFTLSFPLAPREWSAPARPALASAS